MSKNNLTIATFLLLAFFASQIFAQPILTASVHRPVAGDSVFKSVMNVPSFTPGPAGANQSFAFQGVSGSGTIESGELVADSIAGPWTYNLKVVMSGNGLAYIEYFRGTSDSLSYAGFDNYAADFSPMERQNPSKKFPFPFAYGDNFRDDYAGQHQSIAGLVPFTGTVTVAADAWGTMYLGPDTIPNVLRIHTIDTLNEVYLGQSIQLIQECYEYYADAIKFPVLSACTDPFNGGGYSFYSSQRNGVLTGIATETSADFGFSPNPFQSQFRIKANTKGQLKIYSLHGEVVFSKAVISGENQFELANLASGLYFAVLQAENQTLRKLIRKD